MPSLVEVTFREVLQPKKSDQINQLSFETLESVVCELRNSVDKAVCEKAELAKCIGVLRDKIIKLEKERLVMLKVIGNQNQDQVISSN